VLSLPIALLIVGVVGMITGASLSPLSEEGHRRAERWRAFKRTLGGTSETSAGAPPPVERVERWLPYAVAFGTALAWMKRLQKQGVTMARHGCRRSAREGAHGPANIGATVAILSAGSMPEPTRAATRAAPGARRAAERAERAEPADPARSLAVDEIAEAERLVEDGTFLLTASDAGRLDDAVGEAAERQ